MFPRVLHGRYSEFVCYRMRPQTRLWNGNDGHNRGICEHAVLHNSPRRKDQHQIEGQGWNGFLVPGWGGGGGGGGKFKGFFQNQ